ncbi:hypothetical protein Tco_1095987 [Tanacetum coccineum]
MVEAERGFHHQLVQTGKLVTKEPHTKSPEIVRKANETLTAFQGKNGAVRDIDSSWACLGSYEDSSFMGFLVKGSRKNHDTRHSSSIIFSGRVRGETYIQTTDVLSLCREVDTLELVGTTRETIFEGATIRNILYKGRDKTSILVKTQRFTRRGALIRQKERTEQTGVNRVASR